MADVSIPRSAKLACQPKINALSVTDLHRRMDTLKKKKATLW